VRPGTGPRRAGADRARGKHLGAGALVAVALAFAGAALAGRGAAQRAPDRRGAAAVTIGWDDAQNAAARRWVVARVKAARAGSADLVEIPLAVASLGWGCVCPPHYVGIDANTAGVAWLDVIDEGAGIPPQSRAGHVLLVSGYFNGNVSQFEWSNDERVIQRYLQYQFVAKGIVRRQAGGSPRARVVTEGASTCRTIVEDESPLRVRRGPGLRAAVVGEVPVGAAVTAVDVRDVWVRLAAPLAGWVHGTRLRTTCG
jgi:hypothetical protein